MPRFLEKKLKKEYGKNSKVPYKVMNSIGAMHGNKETAKGREMERKHQKHKKHHKHKRPVPTQLQRGQIMRHFKQ